MNTIDWIAAVLLLIGGLNWGLVGVADIDLVQMIFGSIPILQAIVYDLVGLSALYMIYRLVSKKM